MSRKSWLAPVLHTNYFCLSCRKWIDPCQVQSKHSDALRLTHMCMKLDHWRGQPYPAWHEVEKHEHPESDCRLRDPFRL